MEMALSFSKFGSLSTSVTADGYNRISLISCRSRDGTVDVICYAQPARLAKGISLRSKDTFLACFRAENTEICLNRRQLNTTIRCELPPSAEVSSGETVSSLKGSSDAPLKNSISITEDYHVDNYNGNESKDILDGTGGDRKIPPGGGGGGGRGGGDSGGDNSGGYEEEEFGPLLKYEEVVKKVEAHSASLPLDMLEAAKTSGIQELLLYRYLDLQASAWPIGAAMKYCAMFRNRMLADPSFLFKIGTEIIIDSCCATFAEIQKRGKDFWAEFELYAADLLVGVVVNVALVGMLAPYARFGQVSTSNSILGRITRAYGALPSSVFEAERPGCKFSVKQRMATYFYKGFLYGTVGFACGLIGQGIANLIMTAKRSVNKKEDDIPVPPLIKSAALWGVFLAVSSNTRYQIINGLERLVETSVVAKQSPSIAMAFTVGVRFANNIYGGMQFVDWARWSGVQ
ncbi:protein RETICULATA, chloroplastic-like [Zingiber officinale]|uniref:protein RETICULATA, chloroplastic-like n=1 Tax=Zingiber officinale TaxID=94328 RepID=UPI001C4BC133|nr:protein RETICULATA, chloroplastic-like [Zingiber officinale]XP_042415940.1 protein RETICULATA, chloroplastic-like [Zingiber officinale]